MAARGVEAQIRDLVDGEDAAGDVVQDELQLFGDVPSPIVRQAERRKVARLGPGRPEGSQNRAALDLARYIKATRRPALLAMQDVADTPWSELATMLSCSILEAAEFWRKCVAELLPYVERRQPLAVELGGKVMPVLVLANEAVRADLVHGNPPDADELEAIEGESRTIASNVDADEGEVSHWKSHDEGEP